MVLGVRVRSGSMCTEAVGVDQLSLLGVCFFPHYSITNRQQTFLDFL